MSSPDHFQEEAGEPQARVSWSPPFWWVRAPKGLDPAGTWPQLCAQPHPDLKEGPHALGNTSNCSSVLKGKGKGNSVYRVSSSSWKLTINWERGPKQTLLRKLDFTILKKKQKLWLITPSNPRKCWLLCPVLERARSARCCTHRPVVTLFTQLSLNAWL